MDTLPNLAETLANIHVVWVLGIVFVLTAIRLALIRLPGSSARSGAEFLESGIIAVVLVFLLIRPFVVQAYFIPSPSMEPTLMGKDNKGDRILVSKFIYRFHPPQRDDVVVFLAPPAAMPGDPDFIKRLIALPGDTIQTVRGRVVVNGTDYDHTVVRDKLAGAGIFGQDAITDIDGDLQADHHVKFVANGAMADSTFIPKEKLGEILTGIPNSTVTVYPGYNILNGKKLVEPFIAEDPDYDMQMFEGEPLKHEVEEGQDEYWLDGRQLADSDYDADVRQPPGQVPADHYMMMGDNRNDSNDGTNWGPLKENRVVGKADLIFWPPSRMHMIH